jgi:hypothetical protein
MWSFPQPTVILIACGHSHNLQLFPLHVVIPTTYSYSHCMWSFPQSTNLNITYVIFPTTYRYSHCMWSFPQPTVIPTACGHSHNLQLFPLHVVIPTTCNYSHCGLTNITTYFGSKIITTLVPSHNTLDI